MSHNNSNLGTVCITGGLGFIGSYLAQHLQKAGYGLILVDNLSAQIHGAIPRLNHSVFETTGVSVLRGDVNRPFEFKEALEQSDFLIHLAAETGTAQSGYEIAKYNLVNSQGTAALLDWLTNNKHSIKKFVLASSRSIYGEGAYQCPRCGMVTPQARTAAALAAHQWEPICPTCESPIHLRATPEHAWPQPASIYAATKLAQEDLVRITCQATGIPYSILRFQNVYGQGQSLMNPYTGILSIFSTRIRRGLDLPIFEDGMESRDFVHVSDITKAIHLCMKADSASGGVYNVGSGMPTSVLDVANMLIQTFKGRSRTVITGQYRLGDIRHCYADISALQKATGFAPKVALDDGLAAFAQWALSQPLPEDGLDRANQILVQKGLMK